MIFYTLIYTKEDTTFRMLFNSEYKRSTYISKNKITNYTLGEINAINVDSN